METYRLKKDYAVAGVGVIKAGTELHHSAGYYHLPGGYSFTPELVQSDTDLFEQAENSSGVANESAERAIPVIEFVDRKPPPELVKQWEAEAKERCKGYGGGIGVLVRLGYVRACTDYWPAALPRQEIADQSKRLFPDCGVEGHLHKLVEEATEAAEAPGDVTEIADCYITLTAAAMKAGLTPEQVVQAIREKMQVLDTRTWVKGDGGVYKHV